jgi:lysozyme family protein
MNFAEAFQTLLVHEGGFSNDKADSGGATRFGVTEAVARRAGYRGAMSELPLDLAQRIYRAEYWDAIRADDLPATLRYPVFDAAVNSGVGQAVKWLQRAAGVKDDGVIGPQTLAAVNQLDASAVRMRMLSARLRLMASLPSWPAFSRGWVNRICSLMET